MFSAQPSRTAQYAKADNAAVNKEERLRRLRTEVRDYVRQITDQPLLSADWLRVAQSLHEVANIALLEATLPPSEVNPLKQQGKAGAGTLWDQEKEELAVRIVLEEGKINLLMRLLHIYCLAARSPGFANDVTSAAARLALPSAALEQQCAVFEQSAGVLLDFAARHVEALQILDVPELLEHCAEVLRHALVMEEKRASAVEKKDSPASQAEQFRRAVSQDDRTQRVLVVHYLHCVGRFREGLDEDRVFELIERLGLFSLVVRYLNRTCASQSLSTLTAGARFLSDVLSTEAHATDPKRLFRDETARRELCDMHAAFVSRLVTSFGLPRKTVQALVEHVARFERQLGASKVQPMPLLRAEEQASEEQSAKQ